MGRRGRAKQRKHAVDDAAIAAADTGASRLKGMPGFIWLLFETPSGFAIFVIDGSRFEVENPVEHIWANFVKDYMAKFLWLGQFQEFEDKSAAINGTTGLSEQLRDMIKSWCPRGEKLAVGSFEYKEIIEADKKLKIRCTCDDTAMELTWGIKNLMHVLVPQEQKVLTKAERLPMSKGLEMLLHHYGFVVNPEMVNNDIIETACFLYDCDMCVRKHSEGLHMLDTYLSKISGFNSPEWDTMKLATALKMISCPEEEVEHPAEMFSQDELLKIKNDADKYKNKIFKESISEIYRELVYAYNCKDVKLQRMSDLVKKTQETGSQDPKATQETGSQDPKATATRETGSQDPKAMEETGNQDPKAMEETGSQDPKAMEETGSQDPKAVEETGSQDPKATWETGSQDPKAMEETGSQDPKARRQTGSQGRKAKTSRLRRKMVAKTQRLRQMKNTQKSGSQKVQ